MTQRTLLLLLVCASGCTNWNRERADFADYAAYAGSDIARDGVLPSEVPPRSARRIHFERDRDTTAVVVEFDFAPADRDALVDPFLSYDQRQLRMAVQQGVIPASAIPQVTLYMRCGPGPVELLSLEGEGHARYWTEWDRKLRQTACTNRAAQTTAA